MRVALVGQPNSGKSTLFNAVAGYRSATANFPGTTVGAEWSRVRLNGLLIELVDLPGIYSLSTTNPTERAAKEYLLAGGVDLIVDVVDASALERSLELTLELRELGVPVVVCLNMSDEARRKGITIDADRLRELLALPVVASVANRGTGVPEVFAAVRAAIGSRPSPAPALAWHRDIEAAVDEVEAAVPGAARIPGAATPEGAAPGPRAAFPRRLLAVKLLEGDGDFGDPDPAARAVAGRIRADLERTHGRPAASVIMSERHDRAMSLFEEAATLGRPRSDVRVAIDGIVTHPVWGYAVLLAVLVGFFWAVFGFGAALERVLRDSLGAAYGRWGPGLAPGGVADTAVRSLWDGFTGGAAIVLPYLVPFLLGLAVLEDVGYLPRVAYLMDGLLHRIGLHGTSTLPLILGYGCSVPACLATRILPSRRDRFLATVLATLVPCSARSTVIFALVGFYLGPAWALGVFGFNALVVIFSGWLLTRIWPEVSAGMILEVPRYQWPSLKVLARKVWLRVREFVVLSWPLLIGGSLVLGLAGHWGWDRAVDAALRPLTGLLGLPEAVGTTLVFGILRKELSMVMLVQALGTPDVAAVMTTAQILVFTLFITFYIPCVATIAAMMKETGKILTALALGYTFVLATVLGVLARFLLGPVLAR